MLIAHAFQPFLVPSSSPVIATTTTVIIASGYVCAACIELITKISLCCVTIAVSILLYTNGYANGMCLWHGIRHTVMLIFNFVPKHDTRINTKKKKRNVNSRFD